MYDARAVTNWFIEKGLSEGEPFTLMALLHLVYIAHGWHLAMRDAPLFGNRIEAWPYGPVASDVYHAFRPRGITYEEPHPKYPTVSDEADVEFLQGSYDIYGKKPLWELSNLTHIAGGPWDTTLKWGGKFAVVPDDLTRAHYVTKLYKHRMKDEQQAAAN